MRHRDTGPWITAGSVSLVLVLIAAGEVFLLTGHLHPATHVLASYSSHNAMFRALHGDSAARWQR